MLEIPEERIGRKAHFFEMGGHSLSATRLISKIKERFRTEIGLSYVFEHPRLNEIASNLTNSQNKSNDSDDYPEIQASRKFSGKEDQARVTGLLENKVVLVTGGSRGIGRTTARLLASHGASVAINYLKSDQQAMTIKKLIEDDGGIAEIFKGDATDPEQVNDLVNQVRLRFGRIDVLVVNAAIGFKVAPFVDSEWTDFEHKLTNELKSIFLLCKAVTPEMIERKSGSIIAVSSAMSKLAQHGYSAHSAAKAALDAFVRALASELGPEGIRINTVAPGLVMTDAAATMSSQIKTASAARCPLRRNGLPKDVAGAILFLASDFSQYITGTYLPVDGGHTML
ncbi:MAG: SDR family oxidoreductase [Bacillota bacterium]|nr:SDR family oxidoreductase [Bacillota bacterium]